MSWSNWSLPSWISPGKTFLDFSNGFQRCLGYCFSHKIQSIKIGETSMTNMVSLQRTMNMLVLLGDWRPAQVPHNKIRKVLLRVRTYYLNHWTPQAVVSLIPLPAEQQCFHPTSFWPKHGIVNFGCQKWWHHTDSLNRSNYTTTHGHPVLSIQPLNRKNVRPNPETSHRWANLDTLGTEYDRIIIRHAPYGVSLCISEKGRDGFEFWIPSRLSCDTNVSLLNVSSGGLKRKQPVAVDK